MGTLKLFPVLGKVALLLFGLAHPLEGIVEIDHISQNGTSLFMIEIALLVQPASASGAPGQLNLPAGATRANENIPTHHHPTQTALEEQSIGSSFRTSTRSSTMQIGDQSRMYANTRWKPAAPASGSVQVLPSIRQEVLKVRHFGSVNHSPAEIPLRPYLVA